MASWKSIPGDLPGAVFSWRSRDLHRYWVRVEGSPRTLVFHLYLDSTARGDYKAWLTIGGNGIVNNDSSVLLRDPDLQSLVYKVEELLAERAGMSPLEFLSMFSKKNPDPRRTFGQLVAQRWLEAQQAVRLAPGDYITCDIGPYEHFDSPRGYGVTFSLGAGRCHVRFAEKILTAPEDRQDGIIRHEFGHVLDMIVPASALDTWAAGRGFFLPKTAERRADAIAQAVWFTPIRYDRDTVQSTLHGTTVRPTHLGL